MLQVGEKEGVGRGRAGLHRLQTQRLGLHRGGPFGQLPDADLCFGGPCYYSWVLGLTLSQLRPWTLEAPI